ncbi:MAG: ImmA/IrrE family metallo-endopeptidase [Acidobacteriota bacterium]|nr:MAG: ImmA/IrrE family metallo-endopeptidase [Acidobacteriota bacterium]
MSVKKIFEDLPVDSPAEIDIEAIAYYYGALVVKEKLHGSAARIIGKGDRAFITVDSSGLPARQRFSVAHELGHWMIHRGKLSTLICSERDLLTGWKVDDPERSANRFAADLLMPSFLFAPAAKNRPITFDSVRELCAEFRTSLTATAIRLVESGSFSSMLVCSTSNGVKWKFRDRDVPDGIQLHDEPGAHTNAAEMLNQKTPQTNPVDIQASDWFTHPRSKHYEVCEDSVKVYDDTVLSLLWWRNEQQLVDLDQEAEELDFEDS